MWHILCKNIDIGDDNYEESIYSNMKNIKKNLQTKKLILGMKNVCG